MIIRNLVAVVLMILTFTVYKDVSSKASSQHTGIWAVKFKPSSSKTYQQMAEEFSRQHGLVNKGPIEVLRDTYEFVLPDDKLHKREVLEQYELQLLRDSDHVVWSEHQRPLRRVARGVMFNDPNYNRQWHLHNKYEPLHDLNVTAVWSYNISGLGTSVCVVDDGVEQLNPDLVDNFNKAGSYDFTGEDDDPSPEGDNSHGTKCAGLIAAVANNGVCGVGVAYGAHVSGIRMLDGTVTDVKEAKSFGYRVHHNDIYSCSWGPEDDGKVADGPGTLAQSIMQTAVSEGRHGYGNIFVVASGNGGSFDDDCNYDGYANSPYTVTIGAIDEHNSLPYYGEPCSAIFAVTYSSGAGSDRSITTCDITGNHDNNGGCTNRFSGTSAAAPLAAGVLALVLQIRPCATWRDIQHLIVYTAVEVDARGANWVRNMAGFNHSREHGFGRLDAFRIVMAAKVWPLIPPLIVWKSHEHSAGEIPHRFTYLRSNLTVRGIPKKMTSLEHVQVWVRLKHVCRGVLQFELVSPGNTRALLAQPRSHDCSNEGLDWTFSTVMFWGEAQITGTWTLIVRDSKSRSSVGVLLSWKLTLWGTSISSDDIRRRQRLIKNAVNEGVNDSSWLQCPPTPSPSSNDVLYKENRSVLLQYAVVFLVIVAMVWLGDIVLRFMYHKTRQLFSSSSTLTVVQFRCENGEEMVSLLEAENDTPIDSEHNISVVDTETAEAAETLPEEELSTPNEQTIEND